MDLNNDGNIDIISGSWPGEIFFFKGEPNHTFAAPEMLKYKDGEIINVGGGFRNENITMNGRKYNLIAGTTTEENTSEGRFIIYHGKKYKNTDDNPIATTGTASTAHFADWDGDGDYDLIIGDINGKVYLLRNEGTPESSAFEKEQEIAKVSSRAGPFPADWDNDGDMDLLVGADNGSVSLFENKGDRKSPKLVSAVEIVPPVRELPGEEIPKDARRGNRSKICAADWNSDGKLDLLVGDFASQKPDLPEPTPEQKAEYEKIRKELEPIQKQYSQLMEKSINQTKKLSKNELDELQKEQAKISVRMVELQSKLPPEREYHGWIWLFLRK
ncbi:MAG: VCBS repeat-containing protein [Sedimentisphaerales bacterium]|nr:VCBS repeat-containing protein [Sedimentisphaerales bacterium]